MWAFHTETSIQYRQSSQFYPIVSHSVFGGEWVGWGFWGGKFGCFFSLYECLEIKIDFFSYAFKESLILRATELVISRPQSIIKSQRQKPREKTFLQLYDFKSNFLC